MSRAEEQDVVGKTLRSNLASTKLDRFGHGTVATCVGTLQDLRNQLGFSSDTRGWLKLMFVCIPLFL